MSPSQYNFSILPLVIWTRCFPLSLSLRQCQLSASPASHTLSLTHTKKSCLACFNSLKLGSSAKSCASSHHTTSRLIIVPHLTRRILVTALCACKERCCSQDCMCSVIHFHTLHACMTAPFRCGWTRIIR